MLAASKTLGEHFMDYGVLAPIGLLQGSKESPAGTLAYSS